MKMRVSSFLAFLLSSKVGVSFGIVTLPYGSFQGQVVGTTTQFLGIPFAAPPTGERRFGFPEPPLPFTGTRNATEFGASCHQRAVTLPPGFPIQIPAPTNTMSEDCLFINVVRPADIPRKKQLPVLFYFYGGAFSVGDTSTYPGNFLVIRSLALGEPVIYVSANYRLNAFGFLGGKEVKERGLTNIGLHDQRFALKWVQENIAAFGGDAGRVTIMGSSAGAISVGLHMLFDEGDTGGLFSGAIMQSGSPMRLPDVLDQQVYFDDLVTATNCTDAPDRFQCLKLVPFSALQSAVDASPGMFSYQSMRPPWFPMVDETLIPRNPMQLVEAGKIAKIPFITGACEDEGTFFALGTMNVTTNSQFLKYMRTIYFPYITDEQMQALAIAYPDDVTQGSPFNTGTANAITPEYKRISAILGDMGFQAPRRFLLEVASKTQPAYSYRYLRTGRPPFGASHGADIFELFGFNNQTDFITADAFIYFARNNNPNPPGDSVRTRWPNGPWSGQSPLPILSPDDPANITSETCNYNPNSPWPKWSSSVQNPPLLSLYDPAPTVNITSDTYRSDAIKLMIQILKQ